MENLREYRVSDLYFMRCYTCGLVYHVDILVDAGRFEDVVESLETEDKNSANAFFKDMIKKYKNCNPIMQGR